MTSITEGGFWRGRRVLVTGHTGFKGTWLCALLLRDGATVSGLALEPDTAPSLWELAPYHHDVESWIVDVRNAERVAATLAQLQPQTILHLAAQPLVRRGYAEPVATYATNVMGTVHLLEAVRATASVENVVVVTSDKVYADDPQPQGYAEDARLGGADPYAGSKAAAELVVETYRQAFFSHPGSARVVSARAGNVIGGGDFAADRLIPDAYRAIEAHAPLTLRRPAAVRPWQHVLDPLHGYLTLAQAVAGGTATHASYNFGPAPVAVTVREVVERFMAAAGAPADRRIVVEPSEEHETAMLRVDSSRARRDLGWRPRFDTPAAIDATGAWYREFLAGEPVERLVARDLVAFGA